MYNIKEYFKGVSVIKIAFIGGLILGLMVFLMFFFVKGLRAEDNVTKRVVLKKWTTQIIYDTTNACYEGTIKWVVLSNPSLIGQMPSYQTQRQMITHCFCVMDKIRKEFKIEDYQKLVYDAEWTGNLFMIKAMECVAEDKTLPSFFMTKTPNDNETKTVKPKELEDSKDELPSQKPKESEEDSTTIFQG